MSTFDKLSALVVENLNVDQEDVTLEASFKNDLQADSLDVVELVMAIEDEFDIEIPDEDAANLETIGSVLEYIEKVKKAD